MPVKDKAKQAEYARKHYERNTAKVKAAARKHTTAQRKILRAVIADAKRKPCATCGNNYPSVCMDFDHRKKNKTRTVSDMARRAVSVERLKEEMAKCEVVCSNCHRIRTHVLGT